MAVAHVRFASDAIGKWTNYAVILPESGAGPFPVVIQLHGLSDDSHSWIDRSNIVRHVEDYPLVVVLPDGGTSGYLNWKESGRINRGAYEDLIVRDIPEHLRRHFNVTSGPWAIGGLSMGGYGAMRLGLKYPGQFASIWSHSAAFHIDRYLDPALVDEGVIADASVHTRADRLAASGATPPAIAFDCGTGDELIDGNRRFHAHLERLGLPHHYAEHPGAHTWSYWDDHVREALAQHARVLGSLGFSEQHVKT